MRDSGNWDIIIRPRDGLFSLDLKSLWGYRDMFALMVRCRIVTRYKQSVLGPLWYLINPVLSTLVMVFVFGNIVGVPTDGIPPVLFYLLGPALWSYFIDCLVSTSNTFLENGYLYAKIFFPRIVLPLVTLTVRLVDLAVSILIYFVILAFLVSRGEAEVVLGLPILLTPVLIAMCALMALGFGMALSSVSTKYKDVKMLLTFLVSLWMYLTPVLYPISVITDMKIALLMHLNPVTPLMEAFKYSLLGAGELSWPWLGYSFSVLVAVFLVGAVLFNRTQKNFIDTI